jgi:CubicO group peptidase (beta-lactamase class C family)
MNTRILFLISCIFILVGKPILPLETAQPAASHLSAIKNREGASPLTASDQTPDISTIIASFRDEIPARMESENILGLSIALVDGQGVLWSEGFGYTDSNRKTKVTADTLFSIQSMSKSFTATAAMFATQDGLVDLDTPITAYLPDFHINSIFEDSPEQKITMRMLLSHTAGLAHEAPLGGNNDRPTPTFEQHIASISDTWLMFPVGRGYSYSNLGIDLAGYILQVRSGKPFIEYVSEKVFEPLGMSNSTMDFDRVHATPDRAIGHNPLFVGPLSPLSEWAIIPSGGVWTTANDIARYMRFHINAGTLDGTPLLRADLAETMYSPPNEAARQNHYALGISVSHDAGTRELQHGGGGFGFVSQMIWYPELKLGVAMLTNTEHENLYGQLPGEIIGRIISSHYLLYHEREETASQVKPALGPALQPASISELELVDMIKARALPIDPAAVQRRQAYEGTYIFSRWGIPVTTGQIKVVSGEVSISSQGETGNLIEVQPGLLFDLHANAVDLRGSVPMIENYHLVKVNEPARTARIILYPICALVFLSTIFYWPIQALTRRRRLQKGLPIAQPGHVIGWTGLLTGLGGLFGLICLAFIAIIPNLIDVPWPAPWHELRWWQFTGMSLPYIALALAVGAASLIAITWKRKPYERGIRVYFAVAVSALLVFNLVLLI